MMKTRHPLLPAAALLLAAVGWAVAGGAPQAPAPAVPTTVDEPASPPAPPAPPRPPSHVLAAAPSPPPAPPPPAPPRGIDNDSIRVIRMGGSWLGVHIDEVDREKARDLGLDRARGALVTEVIEESPAAKAGLRKDDVIVGYDGESVSSTSALRRMVRETPEGRTVELRVIRSGRESSIDVTISERRRPDVRFYSDDGERFEIEGEDFEMPEIHIPEIRVPDFDFDFNGPGMQWFGRMGRPMLGVSIETIGDQLAEYFDVPAGRGLLVTEVHEGTPAERAGLKAGDVIVGIGEVEVEDLGDLRRELGRNEGETVSIEVVRNRSRRTLDVTLDKPEESGERGPSRRERQRMRDGFRRMIRDSQRARLDAQEALRAARARTLEEREAREEGLRDRLEAQESARREMLDELRNKLREERRMRNTYTKGVEI